MASPLKIHEAKEHMKVAEKYLKTSMFRWKPDHGNAAFEYSGAAQCYRAARQIAKSKECYLKAADCHRKNGSIFHSARCIESAILVAKGDMPPDEILAFATQAASLYQQHGSGDSAAVILAKSAKMVEDHHPEQSYKLYQMAADASIAASSQHQGMEYLSKSSRLLVHLTWFDQAVESIRREMVLHDAAGARGAVGRLTVAMVLVEIARGDVVAAEKAYQEWGTNCDEPEVETIDTLIQAYDENDPEAAKQALASPFIRHMDVEYSRLAANLKLPKGLVACNGPAQQDQAAAAVGTGCAVAKSAEEIEELC